MKSNQPSPVWPYLGILVGLFAIAVSAPRGWESLARRESIQTFLDRHPPGSAPDLRNSVAAATAPTAEVIAEAAPPAEPAAEPTVPTTSRAPVFTASLPQPSVADAEQTPSATAEETPSAGTEETPLADARSDGSELFAESEPEDPPSAPAEPEETPAAPARVPRPERLLSELQRLSSDARTAAWANAVQQLLEELCSADTTSPADGGPRSIPAVLEELRQVGGQGETLAKNLTDAQVETQLLRAQYALARRLEIWNVACSMPAVAASAVPRNPADDQAFAAVLQQVEQRVLARPNSAAWREYLLLDRIAGLATRRRTSANSVYISVKPADETPGANPPGSADPAVERRQVARQLLGRLAGANMSREQRRYLETPTVAALEKQLRGWAIEAVDPRTLLEDLERHEETERSLDARHLADDCRYLAWSSDPAEHRLAGAVDAHYRNANVRLAVAGAFLNRLVPQPAPQTAALRDTIVGADVTGRSTTLTKLTVLLVPDPRRLRVGLEANGVVNSNTAATSGPATFYNNGQSQFVVRKLFLCDTRGLNVFPAVAAAEARRSDLVSLETDYDGVPLVGSMVRGIAMSQHEELQDEARWETERKVAIRARTQLDGEITKVVDKLKTRFNDQFWDVLGRLNLDLEPIALSTTEDRAVMRLRLAGGEQLGAFTPRPRAPSDSLMSLQVHESALNNAIARLDLDGHTFTLPGLFAHLREKLNRSEAAAADEADLPENVVVTFAPEDAVRVSCQGGRVQVRIALAELSEGKRRRWRDFAVCTHYRPDTSTIDIHFVRDGTIYLEGESLKGKPQITLRTIFSKVLSAQRGWGLLSPDVATDPRLADVTISQFTVDEGWIGLAYATRPPAGPVARKPR